MRDLIFDEALRLFATRGYAGASMRELARRCDTSASNVYNYFPSKKVLLEEVFRAGTEQIRETIAAGHVDGRVDLEAYLRSVLATVRENLELWRLLHQLRHDDAVRELLEEDFAAILALAARELRVYTPIPWLLLSLVDGIGASIIQGLPLPDDEIVVATVARAVRAAAEA